jgi:hypothetical protein
MVRVGQKVEFDPAAYVTGHGATEERGKIVTGVVVYVNTLQKWFSVEYSEHKLRTSFKFCDIGEKVQIVGCK